MSDASRLWIRIASIALVVAAAISWLRGVDYGREPVALAPLRTEPGLARRAALPVAPAAWRGQNLLLVTLDTTRPDRLGCYGNAAIETPHLDALAGRGAIFTNAVAAGPSTLPSHASILTGLYPAQHGARANSHYRVDAARETLAEVLAANGYDTAAFVSAFVLERRFGLSQGFAVYDDFTAASDAIGGVAERRGDATTEQAIRWLRQPRTRPFFLWVHYYDPHASYEPPPPFDTRFEQPYDGEIAFVDQQLGRLLVEASRAGAARGTVTLVTADHAEALGEHGEWSHGLLLQEATLRIPLILAADRGLEAGIVLERRVSQVDLMPTLLAGLGIAPPEGLAGVDLAQPPDPDRPVRAETLEGRVQFGLARLAALYRDGWKYVEGPRPELYELASDPLEQRDLSGSLKAEADRLSRQLRSLEGPEASRLPSPTIALDASDRARLEALGYVQAGFEPGSEEARPAPKQVLPVMVEIQDILQAGERDPSRSWWSRLMLRLTGQRLLTTRGDVILALEDVAARAPELGAPWLYLAQLYEAEGRDDEARAARQRAEAVTGRSVPGP